MKKKFYVKNYKNNDIYTFNNNSKLFFNDSKKSKLKLIFFPWLIDIQINGNNGASFSHPINLNEDNILTIIDNELKKGVFYILPTITTNSKKNIIESFGKLNYLRKVNKKINIHLPCFHLEGPYISKINGPRGAHNKEFIRNPSWEEFQLFQDAAEGLIKIVTLAPELKGALKFICKLRENNIIPAIGHTNSNTNDISESIKAGALLSTHLGNGAHDKLKRHPNYIWDQLSENKLWASFIADGYHLSPSTLKVMIKAKGVKKSILVSDASFLRGLPAGSYNENDKNVTICENGVIKLSNSNYLAGSNLNVFDAIINTKKFTKMRLSQIIDMASINPRDLLNKYAKINLNIFNDNKYLIMDTDKFKIIKYINN